MKVGIFIQARSNSQRFPKKVFQELGEKTVLECVVDNCLASTWGNRTLEKQVLVIGYKEDEALRLYCEDKKIAYRLYSTEENDLVSRYVAAAEGSDLILRITGDCPMIPPQLIDEAIKSLMNCDYISNTITRTYPEGYDIQGCSARALQWFDQNQKEDREHPFKEFDFNESVRKKFVQDGFTYQQLLNTNNVIFQKLSVDTRDDLNRLRQLYARVQAGQKFNTAS